jgi:hypothetical protein
MKPPVPSKPRLFLRDHTPRAIRLKAGLSAGFVATIILDPHFAMTVALLANLLWLWVDFE